MRSRVYRGALALIGVAFLAGCSTPGAPAQSASAVNPPAVNEAGTIQCSADFGAPPNQFLDDTGAPQGINVEIMNGVASKIGVRVEWSNIPFGTQIAALQAKRVDAMCTSAFITEERLKAMYMIPYIQWGRGFLKRTDSNVTIDCPSKDFSTPECFEQLSGLTVLTGSGSIEHTDMETWNEALRAASKPEITIQAFESQGQAAAEYSRGTGDLSYHEDPQLAFFVEEFDNVEIAFSGYALRPLGLNTRREEAAIPLADALVQGLKGIKEDGSYDQLVEKWNLTAVDTFDYQR